MLVFVLFELTIVVDSGSFSVSLSLVLVTLFVKQI